MAHEDELLTLAAHWAAARDDGHPPSVETLCGDRRELIEPLLARIAALESMQWLERPDPAEDDEFLSLPDVGKANIPGRVPAIDFDLSTKEFRRLVIESGLLTAGELERVERELASDQTIGSAAALAAALVKRRQLTAYQTMEIAAGRGTRLVLGNYSILDKLGAGGMGQVFRARHRRMDRLVALKVLPESMMQAPGAVDRFQREVKAAARLNHPNIVTAYDADEARGTHFLVMELVEGADLRALVERNGPLEVAQALDCILQAARGLAFAHASGIVHRDVKPANLLVDRQGKVRILDMGLARLTEGVENASSGGLTQDGAVLGTLDYMAPEQAASTRAADARSDIYSLGCTLFFLLAGRPPFGGETILGRMLAHRDDPIPDLVAARPDAPENLRRLFERALAKDPAQRYSSMIAFIKEIEDCGKTLAASRDPVTVAIVRGGPAPMESERAEDCETSSVVTRDTLAYEPACNDPAPAFSSPATAKARQAGREVHSPPRRRRGGALALALGLGAVVLLGAVVYRIQTDYGTIVVEFDDEQVEAVLKKDGLKIRDLKSERTWELKPDSTAAKVPSGTVEIKGGPELLLSVSDSDGVEFKTSEFRIKRGDMLTVRVRLEHKGVAGAAPDPVEAPALTGAADPQRELARLIVERKTGRGYFYCLVNGIARPQPVASVDHVPVEPFEIYMIGIDGSSDELLPMAQAAVRCGTMDDVRMTRCTGLSRAIFAELAMLPKLRHLDVAESDVKDEMLSPLRGHASLVDFVCSQTGATAIGYGFLAECPRLATIYAESAMTDDGLRALASCKTLENLNVTDSSITDLGISVIAECSNLRTLEIAGTKINVSGIEGLQVLRRLGHLKLDRRVLHVESLAKFPMLSSLGVKGFDANDSPVERLDELSKLTSLHLHDISATPDCLAGLAEKGQLTSLQLVSSAIGAAVRWTDNDLASVASIVSLESLSLTGHGFTSAGLDHLAKLVNLRSLTLDQEEVIDEAGVERLRRALPHCKIAWFGHVELKHLASSEADLAAALWVQGLGGSVGLRMPNGTVQRSAPGQALPTESFQVLDANLPKAISNDWSPLAALRNLQKLTITDPSLTPPYAQLKDVGSLREVAFAGKLHGDKSLDGIENLSTLTVVEINGRFNERHIKSLAALPNLNTLRLTFTELAPVEAYEGLAEFPRLTELVIGGPLDADDFPALAKLTNLNRLTLGHAKTDSRALPQLASLKNLKYLSATIVDLANPPLVELARELPELRELHVRYAPQLSINALDGLADHPTLEILGLSESPVDDAWLARLQSWSRLRELRLSATKATTSAGRQALLRANLRLKLRLGGFEMTYWNSGAALEGLVLFPKELPGMERWQLVTTIPEKMMTCCAYSPNGKWLAVASRYSSLVRLYDAGSFELVRVIPAPFNVREVLWSADSQRLALTEKLMGAPTAIYPVDGGLPTYTGTAPSSIAMNPKDGAIAWGDKNTSAIYVRPAEGGPALTLAAAQPDSAVMALAWSPDGNRLASANFKENAFRLWTKSGQAEKFVELPAPCLGFQIQTIAWKPDGSIVAVATSDGKTHLFQPDGAPIGALPITAPLAWHPERNLLYGWGSADDGTRPGLYGYTPGAERGDFIFHTQTVVAASWHPNGDRLVTIPTSTIAMFTRTNDGWAADWKRPGSIYANRHYQNYVAWSADGTSLVRTFASKLFLWNPDGTKVAAIHPLPDGQWHDGVAQNPVGSGFVATNGHLPEAYLFAADGTLERTVRGIKGAGGFPAWSPTGEWLAANSSDGEVRLYGKDGRRGPALQGAKAGAAAVAWSRDGQRIALAVTGQPTAVWNLDGTPGPVLAPQPTALVRAMAWSPDGRSLAVADETLVLSIYWAVDGVLAHRHAEQKASNCLSLRWDADDSIVGVSDIQGRRQRWDAEGRFIEFEHKETMPDFTVASMSSPKDPQRVDVLGDWRHVVFDEQLNPISVGLPLGYDGEWISLAPDGAVLHQSENAAKYLRFLVEEDDGRVQTLTPAEFHARTGGALLSGVVAEPERDAALWALRLGGRLEVFVDGDYFELNSLESLPTAGSIRLQAIELFAGAKVTPADLALLEGLAGLKTLGLYGLDIGDEAGGPISRLASIEQLSLGKTRITDAVLEQVAALPKLTALRIGETSISDEGLKRLAGCRNLRELDVRLTRATSAGIAQLQQALPECAIRSDLGE